MVHVRHAAVAIAEGLYETVLITHGESGRSGFERTPAMSSHPPTSPAILWADMARRLHDPRAALHEDHGLQHEQLAMVSVPQRAA
jgi:hypothetical protein